MVDDAMQSDTLLHTLAPPRVKRPEQVPWPELGEGQAERLKSMRKHLKWALADLAAASGVSIRTIRDIENGKKKGTSGADVMAALADALRVPRGWLTFGG